MLAEWQRETGRPLRIVVGEMWIAGQVALNAPGSPSIMEVLKARSPWVTEKDLKAHGAIVVWSEPGCCSPASIKSFYPAMGPMRRITIPWPREPDKEPITIGYAIIKPAAK
jgi:hypothetical protein